MLSPVPPEGGGDIFSADPPDGSREPRSSDRALRLVGELVGELIMAAFVVMAASVLLGAAIAVAYCSARSAECRAFLLSGWLTLR